ncbi:hypothetical protein DERP_005162 [Dermatophagoides pteronyssinus]|uniref:Uncharacterized protein n=1 Tax=Dermatophagoides pteronyssinus TaxID=6956 RepID=A0ABQ8JMC7_DERPT|nr:hypothetical protein DERP_005162 [Dermatophagoides pteronyssinus]
MDMMIKFTEKKCFLTNSPIHHSIQFRFSGIRHLLEFMMNERKGRKDAAHEKKESLTMKENEMK